MSPGSGSRRLLVCVLVLATLGLGAVQEPLRFDAPVGTETRYRMQLDTDSSTIPTSWPEALPLPDGPPTLLPPRRSLEADLVETVVAPGRVMVATWLAAVDFAPPCPLAFASGRRHLGSQVTVTIGGVRADLGRQLGACYPHADGALLSDYAELLLEGLSLAPITTTLTPYSVPLTPGERLRGADSVALFGGVHGEVDVTYLAVRDGLHHYRVSTYVPFQHVALPGFGGRVEVGIGPVMLEAHHSYHPDGRLAWLQQRGELVTFSRGHDARGRLVAVRQRSMLEIIDLTLDAGPTAP